MFLSDKKGIPGEVYGSEYLGTRKILTIQSQFGKYKIRVSNDVNLKIGSNVKIAAKSGVTKNILDNLTIAGFPAVDIRIWRKNIVKQNKKLK